jgi:hypothetical protein
MTALFWLLTAVYSSKVSIDRLAPLLLIGDFVGFEITALIPALLDESFHI